MTTLQNSVKNTGRIRILENKTVFEKRDAVCKECGSIISETFIPFINKWVTDKCECQKLKEQQERAITETNKRLFTIRDYKRQSGIEPRYKTASFDNFIPAEQTRKALRTARLYAEKFTEAEKNGTGLIFTGNTGSGKTHLACAIANTLLENGIQVKFITYSYLLQTINSANDYGVTEGETIRSLQKARLLIIDDIAAQNATEKGRSVMFSILDKRINNLKPTIFTSNVTSLEELKTRFNEQIYDRIKGSCYKIELLSASHRTL